MGASSIFRTGACLALLLLSPIPSFGRPFLVSDPYPKWQNQPTRFDFVSGKLRFSRPAEDLPNGRKRLKLDLSSLPDGELTLEIKAVNVRLRIESKPVAVHLFKKGQDVRLLPAPPAAPPPPPKAPPPPQAPPEKQKIPPSRTYQGHLKSE